MPYHSSEEIFGIVRSERALVTYFSTTECQVCKVLRPKVERMVAEHTGIRFLYVDSALHPEVTGQHLVFAVPTIILFSDGREMRRFSRNLSLDDLDRALRMLPR